MTHICHWPTCRKPVSPAMWGCLTHWSTLPKTLQDRIAATYVPDLAVAELPSAAYLWAARDALDWIALLRDGRPAA